MAKKTVTVRSQGAYHVKSAETRLLKSISGSPRSAPPKDEGRKLSAAIREKRDR